MHHLSLHQGFGVYPHLSCGDALCYLASLPMAPIEGLKTLDWSPAQLLQNNAYSEGHNLSIGL